MIRALLDTNVVLDVLMDRQPHSADAQRIWAASDAGLFEASVAAFSFPTIFYFCERHAGTAAAADAIRACLDAFEVCALYRECILAAQRMTGPDFEDNLQIACAMTDFVQAIVTRNPDDFVASPIQIYSPAQFLALVER